MIQSIDYAAIAPPLILALVAGLVLLLDAFLPRTPGTAVPHAARTVPTPGAPRVAVATAGGTRHTTRTQVVLGLVTLAGVLGALAIVAAQAASGARPRTFCIPGDLAGGSPSCSFVVDDLTLVFGGVILATAVVVVLLSMARLADGGIPPGEWYFLLLCMLTGAVTLPASRDLIMLVVALELVSLPVFALAALKRYDARGSEAALKLFLVSVISTAVMLFGVSLLYGLTGSVYLDRIAAALVRQAGRRGIDSRRRAGRSPGGRCGCSRRVLTVAVVLVLAGFAFKVAAVPFHFWAGDVYQGAPVPMAALLSVISKAAGFAGLILVLTVALAGQRSLWAPIVAVWPGSP